MGVIGTRTLMSPLRLIRTFSPQPEDCSTFSHIKDHNPLLFFYNACVLGAVPEVSGVPLKTQRVITCNERLAGESEPLLLPSVKVPRCSLGTDA